MVVDNKELMSAVRSILAEAPHKIVISNRRSKAGTAADLNAARLAEKSSGSSDEERIYEKIVITSKIIKGAPAYQAEQFTRTQAFHLNMMPEELPEYITGLLSDEFRQLDSFSSSSSGNIKISKKGKIMSSIHKKKDSADTSKTPDNTCADKLSGMKKQSAGMLSLIHI